MRTAGIEVPGVSTVPRLPVRRVAAVLITVLALGVASASADQVAATKATATAQKPAARTRKQTVAAKPTPATVPAPAPVPADPPLPLWPANDQPSDATVVWNSQGLRIDASNSSLQQILKDVSTDIGVKITGATGDQRIFGAYGPGSARDVLSQLLDGSGYNVLMMGELGQGTPRQVVLTRKPTGPAPAVNNSNSSNDDSSADVEEPPQPQAPPQQPPNMPSGFGPGSQPRTPQQILQEMQQRQQQLEQQQRARPQQ